MKARPKTNKHLPVAPLTVLAVLALIGLLAFFIIDSKDKPRADAPIHEDTVLSVTFNPENEYNTNPISIETDRIVIADYMNDVEIIADNTIDSPVLLTRDENRRLFKSEFALYVLRLPKEDLKQVSKDYAEAYGETLPVTETP